MKHKLTQLVVGVFTLALVVYAGFALLEGTDVLAQSVAFDTVVITLVVDATITIDSPSDVTMSPNITAINNTSTGKITWTVISNDSDGYTLTLAASGSPALGEITDKFDVFFTDMDDATTTFVQAVSSNFFGFSATGTDVDTNDYGSASSDCSDATDLTTLNFRGFNGTDTQSGVATASGVTAKSGNETTICLLASQGSNVFAASGDYRATTSATALVR